MSAVCNLGLTGLVERPQVQNHRFVWECVKSPRFYFAEVFYLKTLNC